jgi:hypothetical protein
MDFEAINFVTEKCLEDLGLETKGDIIALKGFAQRHSNKSSDVMYMKKERDV